MTNPQPGTIGWHDLTVPNAEELRDFYTSVVGWQPQPVPMGEYADFAMKAGETSVAGVCHARGVNADIPAQWIIYVIVEDLDASVEAATRLGGSVVAGPRSMGAAKFAIIRDPAGAVCGLYQP